MQVMATPPAGQGSVELPTRRARKKEQTRQAIYGAAMEMFAGRGYDKVTIEDICQAADVAKATFFLHFSNKAALLQEFNAQLAASLACEIERSNLSATRELHLVVRAFIEAGEKNAPVIREMVREFNDQPALPRAAEAASRSVMDLVAGIVARGQERGEFRRALAPVVVAAALVSAWGTITAWWSEHPDMDVTEVNAQVLDIILNGLVNDEPAGLPLARG